MEETRRYCDCDGDAGGSHSKYPPTRRCKNGHDVCGFCIVGLEGKGYCQRCLKNAELEVD